MSHELEELFPLTPQIKIDLEYKNNEGKNVVEEKTFKLEKLDIHTYTQLVQKVGGKENFARAFSGSPETIMHFMTILFMLLSDEDKKFINALQITLYDGFNDKTIVVKDPVTKLAKVINLPALAKCSAALEQHYLNSMSPQKESKEGEEEGEHQAGQELSMPSPVSTEEHSNQSQEDSISEKPTSQLLKSESDTSET